MNDDIACTIKTLDEPLRIPAAASAIAINPANAPAMLTDGTILTPDRLAVITAKKWPASGVKLTVGFMDSAPDNLQKRILEHMNAWGRFCNVSFALTGTDPMIRIDRSPGSGYASYLGTDNLHIPNNQPTMWLEGFTMNTPDREFYRVVRHETGHALGFPHEHMRAELVARLDVAKTIAWGRQALGWDEQTVRQQILTPLNEASIRGTPHADQESIMAYQLPGSITKDGRPILGGADIDTLDGQFAGSLYPLALEPVDPEKPPPGPGVCPTICDILLQLQIGVGRVRRSYIRGDDMTMNQTEIDQVQAATGACANLQWSKIIANILGGACPPPAAPAGGTCQALMAQVINMFCKP